MADYRNLRELVTGARPEEQRVLLAIEDITMSPRMRALQQKGRFEVFPIFRGCASIIEAGVISYFRGNYISAYLTLVPVIEGVTLRWMGYTGRGKKPDFRKIKRFVASSYRRQPCPGNPLFHEVYVNVADKILREHLFRPSGEGDAHSHFNRHLAAHLLSDSHFGTKENCVRLCLLLDVMSELYIYETYCQDPRFYLRGEEIQKEYEGYVQAFINRADSSAPERTLLLAKDANNHFESNASPFRCASGQDAAQVKR
ncbi:hypothetical protein [Marinobacter sp. GN3S48]|uniref:hypothetical protein n=1 Tax=Marinobacter sp. GN3S48 TaxID=3382302 RepID=UPI00387AED44